MNEEEKRLEDFRIEQQKEWREKEEYMDNENYLEFLKEESNKLGFILMNLKYYKINHLHECDKTFYMGAGQFEKKDKKCTCGLDKILEVINNG